ncbi:MAG TPA: MBL fold metallo-hydrolase [Candidatus Limnocylindrales bacterium]|jgi:glyoxylase-like metal-dependent hydrolase (beta-lactamase superfamily II)/rhodanese-related sulfurtransferase
MGPTMDVELFTTEGLGDASYLVASDGEAVLVDPQRDAWRFLDAAGKRGLRVTRVLETHVHNDYLSGALEIRSATGAEIVAPARGLYQFPHLGADEGTIVEVGGLRLTAWATPGHTPEHLSWVVTAADAPGESPPEGIFSGGSLLVGTAGRTDLLGEARVDELSTLQRATLRRLARLPAGTRVFPTHGAGSFCSVGPAAPSRTTTIGQELTGNPVLGAIEGTGFRDALLDGLGRFPAYYAQMAPLNRAGPRVLGGLPPTAMLDPARFAAARFAAAVAAAAAAGDADASPPGAGATIVDGRRRAAFAAAHIPGSLNIELDESFAAYVGWLLPFDAPVALVMPAPVGGAVEEAVTQLMRIGFEHVVGALEGGIDAWQADGRPIASYPTATMDDVYAEAASGSMPPLLDVRQPIEWRDDGVIPGAQTIFVADLPARLGEVPQDRPITVACKAGSRAAIAASLLDAAGVDVRLIAEGGQVGWPERFARIASDRA